MNNEKQKTHDDNCDCISCDARRQPGGLDHDPSDAEFERHEEEMEEQLDALTPKIQEAEFKKHAEERAAEEMEFEISMTIKFKRINDMTGQEIIATGIIKGFGDAIRKRWLIEAGEANDDTLLVRREDNLGQEFWNAVEPQDVLEIIET